MVRAKAGRRTAGYSGTPLARKLGLKENLRIAFRNPPESFPDALGPLPEGTTLAARRAGVLDLVVLFVRRQTELRAEFPRWMKHLAPAGMLWAAWPKKTSGVATDLAFDSVQRIGLAAGLVDTKICAVDETWSALRFVRRVRDRPY